MEMNNKYISTEGFQNFCIYIYINDNRKKVSLIHSDLS